MKSDKYFTLKLRLKTITPTFIGSNQANELSPYSDFLQESGKVIFIDQNKLEKALANKPGLIDDFVKNIRSSMDNSKTRSEFDLKEFIENNLGDIELIKKYELSTDSDLGKTKIRRFISTNGYPFIPGSTIKGALRTAIIYDWIINSEQGGKKFNSLIDNIKNLFERKTDLEKRKSEGQRLSKEEFEELKSLQKPKEVLKKLDVKLNEQMLFGTQKNNPTGFDARHIKISDTEKFSISNISISKLVRIKLNDESEVSPLPSEIVNENAKTSFHITIEKLFEQNSLHSFNAYKISDFFRILNQFSLATIEYEINAYNSFHNKPKSKTSNEKTDYSNVVKFYQELKEFINKDENKYAIVRLGSGKTYFDNSIGIAIYNKDGETFKQFRELLELGKNPQTKKLVEGRFPTTRTIVEATSLPIGWILIQVFNDEPIEVENIYQLNSIKKNFESANSKATKLASSSQKQIRSNAVKENYLIAEIIDDKSKPPKVQILEGEFNGKETILPAVRLETFNLKNGSKVYVKLHFDKKKLQKAEFKGEVK